MIIDLRQTKSIKARKTSLFKQAWFGLRFIQVRLIKLTRRIDGQLAWLGKILYLISSIFDNRLIWLGEKIYHLDSYLHQKLNKVRDKIRAIRMFSVKLSLKSLSVIMLLALISTQVIGLNAFEAHIINVTAQIVNDIPDIDPPGGEFCNDGSLVVTLSTTLVGASIYYTTDGSDPDCYIPLGTLYTGPFPLTSSATVRARTCHDGDKQSAIMSADFDVASQYCQVVCDPNQELVLNGSFEDPTVYAPELWDIFITAEVPNWTIEWMPIVPAEYSGYSKPVPQLELHRGVAGWLPADGQQYVELDTDWDGPASQGGGYINNEPASVKIHQDIVIAPGYTYTVKYSFSPRPNESAANNILEFSINNIQQATHSAAGGSNTNWTEYEHTFIAEGPLISLGFADLGVSDSLGTFLDKVSMRCVPPAESYCGDGNLDPGEECDDGNTDNGDGCSSICGIEGFTPCLKINEVYYDPDSEHGDSSDEWIELYNTCNYVVNLQNWYLEDNSTSQELIHQNYTIDPGQYVVIASNASTWSHWPDIPDNAFKIALGGTLLFNGLNNDGDRVFLYDNQDNLIDTVSWGTDVLAFDPAVSDVAQGHSISRITAGVDTDTAADWMDTYSGSLPPGPNPGTNPHLAGEAWLLPSTTSSASATIPEPQPEADEPTFAPLSGATADKPLDEPGDDPGDEPVNTTDDGDTTETATADKDELADTTVTDDPDDAMDPVAGDEPQPEADESSPVPLSGATVDMPADEPGDDPGDDPIDEPADEPADEPKPEQSTDSEPQPEADEPLAQTPDPEPEPIEE